MFGSAPSLYERVRKASGQESSFRRQRRRRSVARSEPSRFRRPKVSRRWARKRIRERSPGFDLSGWGLVWGSLAGAFGVVGALVALGWDGLSAGECLFSLAVGALLAALAALLRHVAERDEAERDEADEPETQESRAPRRQGG